MGVGAAGASDGNGRGVGRGCDGGGQVARAVGFANALVTKSEAARNSRCAGVLADTTLKERVGDSAAREGERNDRLGKHYVFDFS